MNQPVSTTRTTEGIFGRLNGRRGHFLLESGYHADLWFDLDSLFVDPAALAPQVGALAALLSPYDVSAICGPLLGGAFLAQAIAANLGVRFYYCEPQQTGSSSHLFSAQYRLPPGLFSDVGNQRVAVVDDAISAGSSVRAVVAELISAGAMPVVVGSLLVLGTRATEHFSATGIPVVAVESQTFRTWPPDECPLCRQGDALEQPSLR